MKLKMDENQIDIEPEYGKQSSEGMLNGRRY
jgi:hypothetical protein